MKIIKHIYIFKETHLPERGWLQGCYVCSQITSRNITFKSIELEKKQINLLFIFVLVVDVI